jgi:hypothetical protein
MRQQSEAHPGDGAVHRVSMQAFALVFPVTFFLLFPFSCWFPPRPLLKSNS